MGILDSMNIGSNALKAHGLRLDIHAKNIANIDTPNYVRKIPVLNASEDIYLQLKGNRVEIATTSEKTIYNFFEF